VKTPTSPSRFAGSGWGRSNRRSAQGRNCDRRRRYPRREVRRGRKNSRKRRSTYRRRRGSGSGNPAFRHCGQSIPPTLSSNRCTAPIGSQAKPISTRSAPRPAMPRREGFGLAVTGETNSTIGLMRAARRRWIGSSGSGSPPGKTPIWASRSAGRAAANEVVGGRFARRDRPSVSAAPAVGLPGLTLVARVAPAFRRERLR
jgi:hypothetical protein